MYSIIKEREQKIKPVPIFFVLFERAGPLKLHDLGNIEYKLHIKSQIKVELGSPFALVMLCI